MTSGTHRQPPPVTAEEVRHTVAAVLRASPSQIGDDTDLVALGLDSLRMMRLSGRWRRSGLKADFHALTAEPTVRAWTRLLNGTSPAPVPVAEHDGEDRGGAEGSGGGGGEDGGGEVLRGAAREGGPWRKPR